MEEHQRPRPFAGRRLLVVEDEAVVAVLVEEMLTEMGCAVVGVAGSLSQGLELLADEAIPIDGAVLDVNLGGETVFPLAERLRARHIPFIFATGYGQKGIIADFSETFTLPKPFRARALENALTTMFPRS